MSKMSRRQFSGLFAATTGALAMPSLAFGATPRVVVVGGGAGGATAARYIAKDSKGAIHVTLVEASKQYYTCFFSNLYLGGFRDYDSIGHGYENLSSNHGVNVVHDWAASVDGSRKVLKLASGAELPYDRLVLSPGIDLDYSSVPGYSAADQTRMPHAWKSGTQVKVLRDQVMNMKQGGTFVMVAPPNPYRCPPGPYERISMIAHNLTQVNPTAKIIILDPKEKFSKQGLFMAGWERHYPGMVEWLDPATHGGIKNVNAETMEIETDIDTFKADAACVIPAQRAGSIAMASGVNDGNWCPIIPATMASKADPNIYVLGDASVASSMPKSGFSANSQAKVAANAIRGELTGSKVYEPRFANTCWSLIATNDGVKVGANYKAGSEKIDVVDKFVSQGGETDAVRKETYEESIGWYNGITADMFS
ncbi:MAG: NAD(P)/FAD-dependent oxidoreductase [Alphaproteobacteria bacterium]|jgi:sulfide dehydrogenase [flavocytochrome c] flavoprotein subunit|nr:NAD(P)/FAD-dependent oxidoreductase [Alphaproteobacteria bacterium]